MTNMSSKMMSSESPPSSASCTVISEVHDTSPAAIEYSSAATLKLPHRGRSNSSSEDDNKTIPSIGFIDPSNIPITVAPARSTDDEDEIIIESSPISVATQTETDVDAIIYTNNPEAIPVDPSPDKLEQKQQNNDCGITCLYYAMQCCDCVIM